MHYYRDHSGSDYTPPSPLPFTPLDLGTGSGDGLQSSNMINTPGGGISSISFSNRTPTSGLYAGNTVGVALSPFGGNGPASPDPLNDYLGPGARTGAFTIIYSAPRTSLDLLWGTVDPNPVDYNQMVFQAGTQTLTGADIDAITGNILTAGAEDVAVQILVSPHSPRSLPTTRQVPYSSLRSLPSPLPRSDMASRSFWPSAACCSAAGCCSAVGSGWQLLFRKAGAV